jgi:hypothetical protein
MQPDPLSTSFENGCGDTTEGRKVNETFTARESLGYKFAIKHPVIDLLVSAYVEIRQLGNGPFAFIQE